MKHLIPAALLSLALASASAAPAPLTVTATATGYTVSDTVQAGSVQVTFRNTGHMPVDLGFFRLKPGVTEAQFRAAATAVATNAAKDASYRLNQLVEVVGGVSVVQPGKRDSATIQLTPGPYLLASLDADEQTHKTALSTGYLKSITVRGPALSTAPSPADYTIRMVDYHFDLPANAAAGLHTWRVTNAGKEPHFALVVKLLPGKTFHDAMTALMSDQQGPPPVDFEHAVAAQVLTTGHTEDVRWNLSAGHYVVVCFVASRNGVEHARMGMAQELVIR